MFPWRSSSQPLGAVPLLNLDGVGRTNGVSERLGMVGRPGMLSDQLLRYILTYTNHPLQLDGTRAVLSPIMMVSLTADIFSWGMLSLEASYTPSWRRRHN